MKNKNIEENKESKGTNIPSPVVDKVLEIAKAVDDAKILHISKDLVFEAAVQLYFLKPISFS